MAAQEAEVPIRPILLALALLPAAAPAGPRTVLFVGNSFTFGANSPVRAFHPERVHDLAGEGIGGVPALFKTFADEAGLAWDVSLETSPGKDLAFHLDRRRPLIDRRWDALVLQGFSTLDAARPGDPTRHLAAARALAALAHARNPAARVVLEATWSRADQTYRPDGHWHGQPIARMAEELDAASRPALAQGVAAVAPVGLAWNRAMRAGVADPDPYDGTAFGQVDLWSWDQYHASAAGYYLAALVLFGTVTGTDPHRLDGRERAADELGLAPAVAQALRAVAADELAARGTTP